MNKQEVIEKINNAVAHETFMTERVWLKYDEAIDIINQLDEPEKPVVPQCVADWFEDRKHNLELYISNLCVNFQLHKEELNDEFTKWYSNFENEPIQTLVKMKLYSYEVEKEKLYKVSFKRNGIGIGVQQQDGSFKEQFTKTELSEYGFDNLDEYEVKEVKE